MLDGQENLFFLPGQFFHRSSPNTSNISKCMDNIRQHFEFVKLLFFCALARHEEYWSDIPDSTFCLLRDCQLPGREEGIRCRETGVMRKNRGLSFQAMF
jgi:hypothetical protein